MQDPAHQNAPSREEWQAIASLFEQVLELPATEREAFLDTACSDNAALRKELDSLLAAHD